MKTGFGEKKKYTYGILFVCTKQLCEQKMYNFSVYMPSNFANKVVNAIDYQNYLAGIFLDLSKAFDTLHHAILLSKLEACGITGTANQWITDYFCKRIQFTHPTL